MNKIDFGDIVRRISELTDIYAAKPMTDGARKAWWLALESESAHDCHEAISHWLRTGTRMPAPADIFKIANERGIYRRERQAEQEKAAEVQIVRNLGATPRGRQALRDIREMLAEKQREPKDGRAWAREIVARFREGEEVADIALRFACEALGVDVAQVVRDRREAA